MGQTCLQNQEVKHPLALFVDEAKARMKTVAILVVTLAIVFAVYINDCSARSVLPEPETLMSKKAVPLLHHHKDLQVSKKAVPLLHHVKDLQVSKKAVPLLHHVKDLQMSKKAVPVLHHLKERAVASQVFDHHRKDQVAMNKDDFLGSPSLSKLAADFDEGVGFTQ